MGKFYELFHMDATVAVNELGLIYMKVGSKLKQLFCMLQTTPKYFSYSCFFRMNVFWQAG